MILEIMFGLFAVFISWNIIKLMIEFWLWVFEKIGNMIRLRK